MIFHSTLEDAIKSIDLMTYKTYIYKYNINRYYLSDDIIKDKKIEHVSSGYYCFCETEKWFNIKKMELRNKKIKSLWQEK
ncbi:hypothetical protein M0Q50_06125 [bacterium]|jgi:hypothetical protein|nr:hypothetical protein [bacterium]